MSAAMKLEIFQNGQLLQEIPLQSDDMWVGRDEACVIRLDDRQISRKHALLRSTDKGVEFEKKSKFGWIKLNGTETTQAMLRDGDRLELGSFEIRV
jgi:predicted component of type VI protein secretion system